MNRLNNLASTDPRLIAELTSIATDELRNPRLNKPKTDDNEL